MNIFLLTETESGCYKWRASIPAKYLRRRGHRVQIFTAETMPYEAPDVMVFYRAHFQEGTKIIQWCRKNGIRVVFDTDDALDLVPPENLNYRVIRPRLPLYHALLGAADIVTTTTETLAAHLRKSNPNVTVVPNSVDPEEWQVQPRSGQIRIGWTGSPTHFADLAMVLDTIRDLQKKHDFTLVLQGICKETSLDEMFHNVVAINGKRILETPLGRTMKHFMAKLSGIRYEFHPNVKVDRHAAKVCDLALDIGIAPLTDNPFNHHKSCIKFYEYAMSGAVTVASHTAPYSEEVPITAKNNRDSWKHKLESVLNGDRATVAREQREWVLEHRNMETKVQLWEQILSGEHDGRPAPVQEAVQV